MVAGFLFCKFQEKISLFGLLVPLDLGPTKLRTGTNTLSTLVQNFRRSWANLGLCYTSSTQEIPHGIAKTRRIPCVGRRV